MPALIRLLHQLAHLYGVQTVYHDAFHHRQQASTEALLAVLRSLGTSIDRLQDVASAWREQQQALRQHLLEPVVVAWDGELPFIKVNLPSTIADGLLVGHLMLEFGGQQDWEWHGADLAVIQRVEVEGTGYVVKKLPLPGKLPWGYHRFILEVLGRSEETLIIAAPLKAYTPEKGQMWGVFLPLYALNTERSWGSGTYLDLKILIEWVAHMGGDVVATLPFLATLPAEPSPYVPTSRLLWNEFYLDITNIPELGRCSTAQALLTSPSFQEEIKAIRNSPLVDYPRQMALKRRVLEELSRCLFAEASTRREELHNFAKANPVIKDYACFRAAGEKQGKSWRFWAQRLRDGLLKEGDYHEENRRYHLYVQWLAHQQVQALSQKAKEKGVKLYLDLPLGVHPDGYDVWRERSAFALDASVGAPPDILFTKGQNWEFPPLHPERIREQGYRYIIACLRHHLRHAGILRIDHVMGFHRLFWIPKGLEASQGVYVHYPAEEFYAILALESHRHGSIIVGEDLGTVPPEVRPAMRRHGLHNIYVLHYELETESRRVLRSPSPNSVACLNTHDMPPFAAFWQGLDIKKRLELGFLDKASAQREEGARQAIKQALLTFLQDKGWLKEPEIDTHAALKACLAFLSASKARAVLVNLEDLWLETQPQNIPSTTEEYPNWRRKARYRLESFCQMPQLLDILREIDCLRKQGRDQSKPRF